MDRLDRKDFKDAAFDVVLRGYDKRQVDERLRFLGAELTVADNALRAASERAALLEDALSEARSTPAGEQLGDSNFGARVEKILKLAEDEAREVRSQADAAALALVEQARAHAAEQDSALQQRWSELDSARQELEQARQEANRECEQLRAQARAEADQIRTAVTQQADQLFTAARADADEVGAAAHAEADNSSRRLRLRRSSSWRRPTRRRSGWSLRRPTPRGRGNSPARTRCINCPGCARRSTRTSTGRSSIWAACSAPREPSCTRGARTLRRRPPRSVPCDDREYPCQDCG